LVRYRPGPLLLQGRKIMLEAKTYTQDSPNAAFWESIELLRHALHDESVTFQELADRFSRSLELLECVPVAQGVAGAMKAVIVRNFLTIAGQESLSTPAVMAIRIGAAMDAWLHGNKVI